MKPSFTNIVKEREQPRAELSQAQNRLSIGSDRVEDLNTISRSRTGSASKHTRVEDVTDEDEVFQTQNRRGFLGQNGGQNDSNRGQQTGRRQSSDWRNKLPNCVGTGTNTQFAAPVDLFVYNVAKNASGEDIVKHMKDTKNLDIIECNRVSHDDARTQIFRIKIKASDYETGLNPETWPYRVRVRVFRHFRQRQEDGGQFNPGQGRNNTEA